MSAEPVLLAVESQTAEPHRETGPLDPRTRLVAARFRGVMEALGLDLADPNLAGTPQRVARALRFFVSGLEPNAEPELRTFPNTDSYHGIVAVKGIRFHSLCAHHFLPFFGTAHVGYLPNARVVGLSKLARAVEFLARRPQVQESLTEQLAGLLDARLQPAGVMVLVEARHLCMEARGVAKTGTRTLTQAVRGAFEDERKRREFMELVGR